MISPTCTPFTAREVRLALGLPKKAYKNALANGAIRRSVHFDSRVSEATALHSLVDIVSFEVITRHGCENPNDYDIWEVLEWALDNLCHISEQSHIAHEKAFLGDVNWFLRELICLGENASILQDSFCWRYESTTIFDAADAWCFCYKRLVDFLIADSAINSALQTENEALRNVVEPRVWSNGAKKNEKAARGTLGNGTV